MKCAEQKKGCHWGALKPESLATKSLDIPPTTSSIRVSTRSKPPPPVAGPSVPKGTKRKQPGDDASPTSDLPTTSPFPPNRAEVIIYKGPPRRSTPRGVPIVIDSPEASPTFSVVGLPSAAASSSGPGPSMADSGSQVSQRTSALALENSILKTRLAAANDRLLRERETHRQEIESLKNQFDREQASYQEYIECLQNGEQ